MSGIALVWAANLKGIKRPAKMVLIQLAERHNKDTGRCDPRIKKLAEDCEMHRATVLRHLAYLEEMGVLTRVSRGGENGGRISSQYQLHMEVESQNATGVESQECDGGKVAFPSGLSRIPVEVESQECDPLYKDKPVKNLKEPDQASILAKVLSQEIAEAFVASRKAMKKPMTVFAAKLMAERLAKMPNAEDEAKRAIRNGWQDVYPENKSQKSQQDDSSKKSRWTQLADGSSGQGA